MSNEKIRVRLSPGQTPGSENTIEVIERNGEILPIVDKTVNIEVPIRVSQLTNDSNFVSDANYVHTDNNFTKELKDRVGTIPVIEENMDLHIGNLDNPHQVTKEQIGLSQVLNIDPFDMPVSRPQMDLIMDTRSDIMDEVFDLMTDVARYTSTGRLTSREGESPDEVTTFSQVEESMQYMLDRITDALEEL